MMAPPFRGSIRLPISGPSLPAGHAIDLDRIDVSLVLAVERPPDRPPGEGVLAGGGQAVQGRRPRAVGQGPLRVDGPAVAIPDPGRLSEAAVGVERPGPDDALGRVDADD